MTPSAHSFDPPALPAGSVRQDADSAPVAVRRQLKRAGGSSQNGNARLANGEKAERDAINNAKVIQFFARAYRDEAHQSELAHLKEFLSCVGPFQSGSCWISSSRYGQRQTIEDSYRIFVGKIPSRKRVRRVCATRSCINPEHIEIAPRKTDPGIVYFLKGGPFIKIGFTRHESVEVRIRQLNPGCPYKIQLLGTIKGNTETESLLHGKFRSARANSEWFYETPEVTRYLRRVLRKRVA